MAVRISQILLDGTHFNCQLLQGGHFDLADRMFHSVADAWLSASRNNMADVKELIPEFFSLPEMFLNSNHFDLGIKQNGVALDDVILPRWAKGDPREFVRIHRQVTPYCSLAFFPNEYFSGLLIVYWRGFVSLLTVWQTAVRFFLLNGSIRTNYFFVWVILERRLIQKGCLCTSAQIGGGVSIRGMLSLKRECDSHFNEPYSGMWLFAANFESFCFKTYCLLSVFHSPLNDSRAAVLVFELRSLLAFWLIGRTKLQCSDRCQLYGLVLTLTQRASLFINVALCDHLHRRSDKKCCSC